MKRLIFSILLTVVSTLILLACNSTSTTASDTLSAGQQAQVEGLIAAALKAVPAPSVFIHGASLTTADGARRTLAVTGCVSVATLGTLTGRPRTSNPIADGEESGISGKGYYFTISGAPTANDCGDIATVPANVTIYFSDASCHTPEGVTGMSKQAIAQGFVFHSDLDGTDPGFTDAGHYWTLAANTAPVSMSYQSLTTSSDGIHITCLATYNNGAGSSANNSGTITAYPVVNNDPTVTGIPNAPVQGPLTVGP